jgi:DNA-binding IclR family transcriptional regulator
MHRTATGKLLLSQRPDLCAGLTDRRLLAEIDEARRTGIAWNRRESDPNITAIATWAGKPSAVTPVICVKWPFFRFTEAKARQALASIRRHLGPA